MGELPESPGHGHRHSSGTQHPAMRTTIRHSIRAATLPRSCQPSSHHDWLTRRSSSIPRIWEPTGWGRSTGSRHLHCRMCRPSRRVTSVLGHQLPRGMSGDRLGVSAGYLARCKNRTCRRRRKAVSKVEEARAQDRRGPPGQERPPGLPRLRRRGWSMPSSLRTCRCRRTAAIAAWAGPCRE